MQAKKGRKEPLQIRLHEYYTPKPPEIQAVLVIFTIFVNYADFYVNIIMLTCAIAHLRSFIIFDDISRCCGVEIKQILNVVFASNLARYKYWVNYIYLTNEFVQLNDRPFFCHDYFCSFPSAYSVKRHLRSLQELPGQ